MIPHKNFKEADPIASGFFSKFCEILVSEENFLITPGNYINETMMWL